MAENMQNATQLLAGVSRGDEAAAQLLMPLVYAELRALAGSFFRTQPKNQTLQPTALVHEAFLRLIEHTQIQWASRAHFMAVASLAMRQILADHARRRATAKRGGNWGRVSLQDAASAASTTDIDLEQLDVVLSELESLDPRRHRIVLLRYFGGLTVEETASVMNVSVSTVESDWRSARAWLSKHLSQERSDES